METRNYRETGIFPETIDTDADILPFRIDVQGHVLNDLKKRIAATRWIDEIPGAKWEYGTSEGRGSEPDTFAPDTRLSGYICPFSEDRSTTYKDR